MAARSAKLARSVDIIGFSSPDKACDDLIGERILLARMPTKRHER
jgi:hypothetical protein